MRHSTDEAVALGQMETYSQSDGLHFMFNFTVALARLIGLALWWIDTNAKSSVV